jgi:hypothetical protein
VIRAARALQERCDRPRRTELADELDVADVDAELERGGCDQRAKLAAFQPLLGVEAALLGEAAMVRGDDILADELGQMPRHALRHAPRVDEDERRAMLVRQRREARVDLLPDLARHDGFERRRRKLEGEIAIAHVSDVDDRTPLRGGLRPGEVARNLLDRLLRRRKADAHRRRRRERREALERQREMASALVGGERMDLVDDHRPRGREHLAAGLRTQEHVQRLRSGDDDLRRPAAHAGALALRRVAGSDQGSDLDVGVTERQELGADARERRFQVALNVVGQRLQRRDVDDRRFVGQRTIDALPHEIVDGRKESGERLARAGRRRDQHVATRLDRRPRPAIERSWVRQTLSQTRRRPPGEKAPPPAGRPAPLGPSQGDSGSGNRDSQRSSDFPHQGGTRPAERLTGRPPPRGGAATPARPHRTIVR